MKCPLDCYYYFHIMLTLALFGGVFAMASSAEEEASSSAQHPSYLARIQQLRNSAGTGQKRTASAPPDFGAAKGTNKSPKPKRYKCILLEDEDEEGGGGVAKEFIVEGKDALSSDRLEKLKSPSFVKELRIKARQRQEEVEQEGIFQEQHPAVLEESTLPSTTPILTTPLPPPTTPRTSKTSWVKPLRQIILPRAQGIPLSRHLHSPARGVQSLGVADVDSPYARSTIDTTSSPSAKYSQSMTPGNSDNNQMPRDAENRPLILAPENCRMIEQYARMYGVRDVKSWVHHNCSFAQMYLPTASCAEIDVLVASCNIEND